MRICCSSAPFIVSRRIVLQSNSSTYVAYPSFEGRGHNPPKRFSWKCFARCSRSRLSITLRHRSAVSQLVRTKSIMLSISSNACSRRPAPSYVRIPLRSDGFDTLNSFNLCHENLLLDADPDQFRVGLNPEVLHHLVFVEGNGPRRYP